MDELWRCGLRPSEGSGSAGSLRLPDNRVVVVIGLTRDEARACVPLFMSPARITVSAA